MFDSNFYPTPDNIISKLVSGISFGKQTRILEPSAGKGNICNYILQNFGSHKPEYFKQIIHCIEKNFELQGILKSNGFKVVDTDFLTYDCEVSYSLILMNPPFDHADKHLLKAIEIRQGAEIRCLYPTESINNPYSKERQLALRLIEQNNGTIK